MRVLERQILDEGLLKCDFGGGLLGFLARPRNHFGRRVDPVNPAGGPDTVLSGDCECSCSATHVQNRLARLEPCKFQRLLAISSLPAGR